MKKKNIIGCIFLGILAILVVFLATVFIVNKIKSGKEKELLVNNPGRFVEIDGHNMCIYEAGQGEHTLVFLSGAATVSPILDFKSLYSLLSDDFKIVVIEKFGYGFSDVVDEERSFETILRQDREILSKSGIKAPYILCPHSMSGLETIMWAQKAVNCDIAYETMAINEACKKINENAIPEVPVLMFLSKGAGNLGERRL